MFPFFVGVNEKFLNVNNIDMIEDVSTETESKAIITTAGGNEIELTGNDADLLFERAELFAAAGESAVNALIAAGNQNTGGQS